MPYIFRVTNDATELVFSDQGTTYSYIGRATLQSLGQASGGSINKTRGRSVYTINWPANILVALPVKANGTTALLNTTRSGDTWTIQVHKGNGSIDADGFDIEEATEVYVFGAPLPPGNQHGWGLWIYSDDGTKCLADLSRRPLTWRGRISMGTNVDTWTPPTGVSVPAIIGMPFDYNVTSVSDTPFFIIRYHGRGWQMVGGNIVRYIFQDRWVRQDSGSSAVDLVRPLDAILIDAAGL